MYQLKNIGNGIGSLTINRKDFCEKKIKRHLQDFSFIRPQLFFIYFS